MKHELEIKVQAWLDGELPEREARQVGEWVARDAEASALAQELGCIRQAMSGNETAGVLGEGREFYWSKIQRQIQREAGRGRSDDLPWHVRLRKYMAPLAGAAALACVLLMAVWQGAPTFDEISSTSEGMEAVTFHDQSAQMTVVWLQDSSAAAEDQTAKKTIRYEDEPGTVIDLE
jgi:negative regulator of sigma E activity